MNKNDYSTILKLKGWKMYYSCFCGGSLKQYWNNKAKAKGFHFIIRPTKNTVQIFRNNHLKHSIWIYQLDQKMTENGIDTAN